MQDDLSAIPRDATLDDASDRTNRSTRSMSSADLFAGSREVQIDHNGRCYRLRITQTGKLILTA